MIPFLFFLSVFTISGLFLNGPAASQILRAPSASPTPTPAKPEETLYRSYRGVSVGSSAADVAAKLGTPAQHSKAGDYYAISATETVQIAYSPDQTVKSVTINFTGDLKSAPTAKEVLGEEVKKDADGIISKMVSFPKDGYWASYTRTSGKDSTVIITLQKLASQ